ncbi:MAG: serine--tRNA ligase [Thaumarchaeota archaeon]|nr:serine--tRNA ligase [Nitrososphaerota archaeon]MCL5317948.1 serine--tRNA ligase [Nitrososphaerota archaeon]
MGLDMAFVRSNPEVIRDMLRKRHMDYPLDQLLSLDEKRRSLITKVQELKQRRNTVSSEIAEAKKNSLNAEPKISEMRLISQQITSSDAEIREAERQVASLLADLPNIPDKSVPEGAGEADDVEIHRWGEPPRFSFEPKDHIELASKLDLIDIERAAKVAGARFYFLRRDLVRLNYALIRFGLDILADRGFILIQPPYMLNRAAIGGSIILHDFEDVIYKIEGEDLHLIGTSEHAIAAMHMNEIFDGADLPLRYAGVSSCFRKEAGAHGRDMKGIFRVHQFEKIEQFIFSRPEDSWNHLEEMIRNAQDFFQALEIPYRVVALCGGELGKVSAKTYDMEAWFPGQNKYREVVSCSNCTDYQARGLLVKYRAKPHEPSQFVHTLNSTLTATERTLVALMENHQQEDGSIVVPKALRPYASGLEAIRPVKRG